MTLTPRQRAKINAALCLIHDNGHDAKRVTELANKLMKQGTDPRSPFETALNDFIAREPVLSPVISKALKLVDASDDQTVDQYDAALSDYVNTGNDSSLRALAPMIAEDSLALAVRDGEITAEEAASGDLAKALGFQPGEALVQVVAEGRHVAEAQPQQAPEPQQFQFSDNAPSPKIGQAAHPKDYSSQHSIGGSSIPVTGMVAPKAAQLWARDAAAREAVAAQAEGAQSL